MYRTNLYLDEEQTCSLDEAAQAQGMSLAALIRRLIGQGLTKNGSHVESDLLAIGSSFGVLTLEDEVPPRGPDERSRHLGDVHRRQ